MAKTCITIKLTKTVVDNAGPIEVDGKTRQMLYRDTLLSGFGLCAGKKTKTFFAQRSVKGKSPRITIGPYGVFTVTQARREAQKLLGKMAQGINPVEERRRERIMGLTLGDAWKSHLDMLNNNKKSQRTIDNYKYSLDTYLSDWLNKPLNEITVEDARIRHKKIAKDVAAGKYSTHKTKDGRKYKIERKNANGEYTANAAMRVARAVYNNAMGNEDNKLSANPFNNVYWYKERTRKSAIKIDQLKDWYKEIQQLENPIRRDYILFVLFTGLRRTSASEIRWEHVDFDNAALHIPKPKGGEDRAFDLPLSDFLTELLLERKKTNELLFHKSPWVFPANSASGHISEPKIKTNIPFTIHNLRGIFVSIADNLDISHYAIKLLVNHSLPKDREDVTAGYIKSTSTKSDDLERLRKPMQQIADKLLTLLGLPITKLEAANDDCIKAANDG